jgi:hypothetical protein
MVVALPDGNKADAVARALIDHMGRLPAALRRSLTWDRGSEMAQHSAITAALALPVFFCDPHHPWQRGTNENTNRLLRKYLHRTPTWPRSPRTSSMQSLRNSTSARVECSARPPRQRRSVLPSRNRCCLRLPSRCGSRLRS